MARQPTAVRRLILLVSAWLIVITRQLCTQRHDRSTACSLPPQKARIPPSRYSLRLPPAFGPAGCALTATQTLRGYNTNLVTGSSAARPPIHIIPRNEQMLKSLTNRKEDCCQYGNVSFNLQLFALRLFLFGVLLK